VTQEKSFKTSPLVRASRQDLPSTACGAAAGHGEHGVRVLGVAGHLRHVETDRSGVNVIQIISYVTKRLEKLDRLSLTSRRSLVISKLGLWDTFSKKVL
jgi:hypothetical protein